MPQVLKTLWLTDNCIGDEGAVAIGEALRVNRSAITRLSLFRNSIRDKGSVATAATLSSALASKRDKFSRFSPCTARRGANHLSQSGVLPGGRSPNHWSPIAKRPQRDKSDRPASGVDSLPLVTQEEQKVELQRPPRRASLLSAPARSTTLQPHLEDEASVEVKVVGSATASAASAVEAARARVRQQLGAAESLDDDKLVMDFTQAMRVLSPHVSPV